LNYDAARRKRAFPAIAKQRCRRCACVPGNEHGLGSSGDNLFGGVAHPFGGLDVDARFAQDPAALVDIRSF